MEVKTPPSKTKRGQDPSSPLWASLVMEWVEVKASCGLINQNPKLCLEILEFLPSRPKRKWIQLMCVVQKQTLFYLILIIQCSQHQAFSSKWWEFPSVSVWNIWAKFCFNLQFPRLLDNKGKKSICPRCPPEVKMTSAKYVAELSRETNGGGCLGARIRKLVSLGPQQGRWEEGAGPSHHRAAPGVSIELNKCLTYCNSVKVNILFLFTGSTLSLGSSVSLSKSLMSVSSPSKSVDLLTVLTHILGQSVPRGGGQGEFVCGKCVCLLERVFKFDTVIARVRVLSSERLQKLTHERDKIRQWVRQNYCHRHLQDFQSRSSTSEEEGEVEKEGYREMLKENMALSEYECWSEKWDTCPYFIRTGKRCRKGKGCEGCDSLRVSDSDYESVCGVPRHMPFQPFSPLSQDRSQSVPLHWQRVPSVNSSPASLAGSSLSLRAPSHTESIQSLDSLDGNDPFDSASDQSVNFMLRELRSIGGKPVSSPSGSKIPVLGKRDGRYLGKIEETASPTVTRVLNFRDVENGGDEENGDVLTLLRDEFMPLHREVSVL